MHEPLNPTLYKLLASHFGEVAIVAEGQSIDWTVSQRAILTSRNKGVKASWAGRTIVNSGEEYRVNCPFCSDLKQRLYINHRWGVFDEETGSYNLFMTQCFNEQCVDGYEKQRQLQELVFSSPQSTRMRIKPGKKASSEVGEVRPPGPLIRLDELMERHPHHAAIEYMQGRQLDPARLARQYGVYYCPSSRYSLAQNRIICTMHEEGQLVGWQARYIGTPPNKKIPKYWTCPGMPRRLLAYNYDNAIRHHTIPIVEGPTDVWNTGPMSMGLLGKTMNMALQMRFKHAIALAGTGKVIPVILDPIQDPEEKAKGKPHHIEKLVDSLRPLLGERVFGMYLPEEYDPGSIDREFFWELIKREARKHGLKASFTRPEVKDG